MPRAIFTVYLILWPVFTFNLTVSDLLRAPFTTWGWVGSAWCGLKCDFRITGESDTNGMDRDGGAAWWAYQSVLRLLRGLSRRQARLHRPFPMAICLCPLSFPILAPPFFSFHLFLPLVFDCSFWTLSLVRSAIFSGSLHFPHHHHNTLVFLCSKYSPQQTSCFSNQN